MKRLANQIAITILVFIIAGCANTPSGTKSETPAITTNTVFTTAEQRDYARALKQLSAGEAEKAEKTLSKLSRSHSSHMGLWINLANARYQTNNFTAATDALTQAKTINAKAAEIYNLSGLIAVEQQDYKTAESLYLKALSLNKNYANAHYNLALVYDIFYQDISNALIHYQQYLALIPEGDAATSSWVEELKLSLKRRNNG